MVQVKNSKMLAGSFLILAGLLGSSQGYGQEGRNDGTAAATTTTTTTVSSGEIALPACFVGDGEDEGVNVDEVKVGQYCVDVDNDNRILKHFKNCKASDSTSIFSVTRCLKKAKKSEVAALLKVRVKAKSTGDCDASACTKVAVTEKTGAANDASEDDLVVVKKAGKKGSKASSSDDKSSDVRDRVAKNTHSRSAKDTYQDAQDRYVRIYGFCRGGDAESFLDDVLSQEDKKDVKDSSKDDAVATATTALATAQADLDKKFSAMTAACRDQCLQFAAGMAEIKIPECILKPDDLCKVLRAGDEGTDVYKKYIGIPDDQDVSTSACVPKSIKTRVDGKTFVETGALCSQVFSQACTDAITANKIKDTALCGGKDYANWKTSVAALNDATNALKDAKDAAKTVKESKLALKNCSFDYLVSDKSVNEDGYLSCTSKSIEKATTKCDRELLQAQTDINDNLRYCTSCGGGQGGTCGYGPCKSGISSAAQILSAAGNIAVPLGLGLMNMSMYNHGLNSCNSNYAAYLNTNNNVGTPSLQSNCGAGGGFGMMGGMLGGMMGGMGMNPMMGGMGMNPMMGGMGLNINAGIGNPFLMNGMGGMGMNPMMGGYNPMMGGMTGGYNPMMGGMNGGYNPMMGGMNGGYNPMMGGMNGGMLGQYNPAMTQGNMYGVQQQMMDAQTRMQALNAQNMVMGQSQNQYMYNGMNGGMGMNPMMGGMGLNTGIYNPFAYSGMNTGVNFNAGLNLNLNSGYNPSSYYNPQMMIPQQQYQYQQPLYYQQPQYQPTYQAPGCSANYYC